MYTYKPIRDTIVKTAPWASGSTGHALSETERYQWALNSLRLDLRLDEKMIRNLQIKLNRFEDYDQIYCNSSKVDKCRRFWFDVSYEQELWDGPRLSCQIVHKRIIEKAIEAQTTPEAFDVIWRREIDQGMLFVQKRIPEAVHRVGCNCCYGDGPDLMSQISRLPSGDYEIAYSVDFDFVMPEVE